MTTLTINYKKKLPDFEEIDPKLQKLSIDHKKEKYVMQFLSDVCWKFRDSLMSLVLISSNLTNLPEEFNRLTNLTDLSLPYNYFLSVPECVMNMNLVYLDMQRNRLEEFLRKISKKAPSFRAGMNSIYSYFEII